MENKLLPCPFCGGEAKLWSHHYAEEDLTLWQVRCNRDFLRKKCYMNDSFVTFGTEEEAIEAWNTRAECTCRNVAEQGILFECSECGAKTVDAVGNYTQEYCAACGRRVQDDD